MLISPLDFFNKLFALFPDYNYDISIYIPNLGVIAIFNNHNKVIIDNNVGCVGFELHVTTTKISCCYKFNGLITNVWVNEHNGHLMIESNCNDIHHSKYIPHTTNGKSIIEIDIMGAMNNE